jgi:CelD/BcsL family acetyltransferase involved in cellulose biosynthesis
MKVRIVSSREEFFSLRATWNSLLQESEDNHVFLTWEWLFTWWTYYGEGKDLAIIVIEDGGRINGIAPLMLVEIRIGPFSYRMLENIGSTEVDLSGVIIRKGQAGITKVFLEYFGHRLQKDLSSIRFSHLPGESAFVESFRNNVPKIQSKLKYLEKIITICPYIELTTSTNGFLTQMKRKRRHNLLREKRILEKQGLVEYEMLSGSDSAFPEEMEKFFLLHQERWKEKNLSSMFSINRNRKFFLELAENLDEIEAFILSTVKVNGKAVSVVYGFLYLDSFYYYLATFDRKFFRFSIGHLHILYLIDEMIKKKTKYFNFLKGEEGYKLLWTKARKSNLQVTILRNGLVSDTSMRLALLFLSIQRLFRRGLKENFYLYLDKRRQIQELRSIK